MIAIELAGVSVMLGGRRVVDEVTVAVGAGEWVALIGPNGAGKTTLLRAIAGLLPFSGRVVLHGRPAGAMHRRERARALAIVPQAPSTPPWLTVGEYVLLGRTPYLGVLAHEGLRDREAAARALERLDLLELADRPLGTLSGGEKQRAVVARALAQEASSVLLDEPTAALDVGHQQQALELLDGLRRESGLTLLAAMHDLTLAAQYADRILLLDAGSLVADGSPVDVLTSERLARHYEADVEVLAVGGRVAVVPRRQEAARQAPEAERAWVR
jgi:iron complex transport system ATP-binding protein